MARFAVLAQPAYGDAWLQALRYDGAGEWRARFWGLDGTAAA